MNERGRMYPLVLLAASAAFWFLLSALASMLTESHRVIAAEAKGNWRVEWERTLGAAKKEGEVFVYGPSNRDEQKALIDGFQKAYGEIRLTYVSGRLSQLAYRIMAERRAGKYLVDILMGSTTTPNTTLKPAGVFEAIRPALILPEVLDASAWFKKKHWFGDNEERYLILWRGGSSGSFMINTHLAKREEFKTYWDVLRPKWKGKIVAQDPRLPGRGYSTTAFLYHARDYGPDYLRQLFRDTGLVLSRDSRQMVDWLGSGKYAIGLFVGSSGETEAAIRQGLALAEVEPAEGSAPLGTPRAVTLVQGAPNPNAAKVYINWLLSRAGQIAYQRATGTNSLRTDIPKDDVSPSELLREDREYIPQNLERYEQGARAALQRIFGETISQR